MIVGLTFGRASRSSGRLRFGIMVAMHLGTPCQSFPMARVPAVRTKASWLGPPDLTQTQSPLANMGHQLVSVFGKWCFAFYTAEGISLG